jgi:Ca-activated chloride channel family protein
MWGEESDPQKSPAPESKVTIEPRAHGVRVGPSLPAYNLSIQSTLVLIPVNVTDSLNHFVPGLHKESFKVFEDDQPQEILTLSSEDAPASVGVVLDWSGSMKSKMERSRQAVTQFLRLANPQDEFFLVQVNDGAELAQSFTRNPEDIENSLTPKPPSGHTALLDSVYRAILEMKKAQNPRKALLLISDGGDNHSRYSENELRNLVRESDVQVYAIGIYGTLAERLKFPEQLAGPRLLRWLAQESGGRHYPIGDVNELTEVSAQIALQIREQYILGYSPHNPQHDGKYRRVHVKVDRLGGDPPLRVSWRSGYRTPSQ